MGMILHDIDGGLADEPIDHISNITQEIQEL